MAQKISADLQKTVAANPHIEEVHFTANGEHFFNVHEHKEKGAKTSKKYGRMALDVVPSHMDGTRQIYKQASVPMPEYEIVETLSREDVLNAKVDGGKVDDAAKLKAENEELKKKLAEAEKAKVDGGKK